MVILLGVSILSFLTLFERGNTNGVVDDVRYIVDSDADGVREITFYFTEPGLTKKCTATTTEEGNVTFVVEDAAFVYQYTSETDEVTAEGDDPSYPFATYTKALFKRIAKGPEKFMKFWQAGIVAVICLLGGAVIMWSEEIWLFIHKKENKEPKWNDMKGIRILGGAVIALGVVVLILFVVL